MCRFSLNLELAIPDTYFFTHGGGTQTDAVPMHFPVASGCPLGTQSTMSLSFLSGRALFAFSKVFMQRHQIE